MLSRPNMVMNQGRPAAGRLRPARDRGRETQRGEIDEAAPVRRLQLILVAFEPRCTVEPLLQIALHVAPARSTAAGWSAVTLSRVDQTRAARADPKVRPVLSIFAGAVAEIVVALLNISRW
jgi:hypothetical protein